MLLAVLPSSPAIAIASSVGGEWAGWRVSYSPAGELQRVPERFLEATAIAYGQIPAGFEELTSEAIDDDSSLSRRVVRIPPQDGCSCEDLIATVEHHELPLASLVQAPGVWSLDEEVEAGSIWRVRCAFDGLGGPWPRAMRGALPATATRTRVELLFDAAAGRLVDEPLTVWQERQWDEGTSLEVRSASGGRSGLDAAWVSAAIGMSCWAEAKAAVGAAAAEESELHLSLPGGITVVGSPGCLEVLHQRTDKDGVACGDASSVRREFSSQGALSGLQRS